MRKIPTVVLHRTHEEVLIDLKNKLEYSIHKLYSDLHKYDRFDEDEDIRYFLREFNSSQGEERITSLIIYINVLENHLSKAINSLSTDETIRLLTRGRGV